MMSFRLGFSPALKPIVFLSLTASFGMVGILALALG